MPLADGPHTVKATARDAAGNTSAESAANTFTVDTTAPAAPVVLTPANGSTTSDNTPAFSGTAEADSTVSVIVDGTPMGPVTADASGNWSFTPTAAPHEWPAHGEGHGGGRRGQRQPRVRHQHLHGGHGRALAPVVLTPANGSITRNNMPTYSGTAEEGSTVTVYVDGASVGTITADAAGTGASRWPRRWRMASTR